MQPSSCSLEVSCSKPARRAHTHAAVLTVRHAANACHVGSAVRTLKDPHSLLHCPSARTGGHSDTLAVLWAPNRVGGKRTGRPPQPLPNAVHDRTRCLGPALSAAWPARSHRAPPRRTQGRRPYAAHATGAAPRAVKVELPLPGAPQSIQQRGSAGPSLAIILSAMCCLAAASHSAGSHATRCSRGGYTAC